MSPGAGSFGGLRPNPGMWDRTGFGTRVMTGTSMTIAAAFAAVLYGATCGSGGGSAETLVLLDRFSPADLQVA